MQPEIMRFTPVSSGEVLAQFDVFIRPEMLDKNGVVRGVDLNAPDIRHIGIHPAIASIVIDQAIDLPEACLWFWEYTSVKILGDVRLQIIGVDIRTVGRAGRSLGDLTIHGSLTTSGAVLFRGALHVTGTIRTGDSLTAFGTIHCNGSIISGSYVFCGQELFVSDGISASRGVHCDRITIYAETPIPSPIDDRAWYATEHGKFRAPFQADGTVGPFRQHELLIVSDEARAGIQEAIAQWNANAQAEVYSEIDLSGPQSLCGHYRTARRGDIGGRNRICDVCRTFQAWYVPLCQRDALRRAHRASAKWARDPANPSCKRAFQAAARKVENDLILLLPPVYVRWPGWDRHMDETL